MQLQSGTRINVKKSTFVLVLLFDRFPPRVYLVERYQTSTLPVALRPETFFYAINPSQVKVVYNLSTSAP